MAYFGFEAVLADGRRLRECDGVWDQVPHDIKKLSLYEAFDGGEREVCSVEPVAGESVYFFNEAINHFGMGVLAAKAIGIVHGDTCSEFRLIMLPRLEGNPPILQRRTYESTDLRLDVTALRRAA